MKRTLVTSMLAAAAVSFLAFGGTALAQKAGKAGKGKPAAAGYSKVKTYDFSGDTIDGELVKPEGEGITAKAALEHRSLIRLREDFIREIVKSAENLD
jgi:hypothetical protein